MIDEPSDERVSGGRAMSGDKITVSRERLEAILRKIAKIERMLRGVENG